MSAEVSAVVVNHDGQRTLNRTIEALLGQTLELQRIVVVDNGSSDDSLEKLEIAYPDVDIVRLGENLGLGAGRNAGIARADTRWVVTVDDDIYLERDAVERLVEAAQTTGAAVTCPRFVLLPERQTLQADGAEAHFAGLLTLRRGFSLLDDAPDERVEVGAASGGCYCIDRRTLPDAELFDELYFFYMEDLEFSLRVRAAGHTIVFDSAAVGRHDRGQGEVGLAFRGEGEYPRRRAHLTLRNHWLTIAIHYQARTLWVLAPALLLYEIASFAVIIRRGWGGEWLRASTWMWAHRAQIRERRARAAAARKRPDGALLAGGPLPFAPGFLRSPLQRVLAWVLSSSLDLYWRLARAWIAR